MPQYFLVNKPYDMLSQFTREVPEHRVLGDLYAFPPRVYPVGRLDRDSEGLLLLTDDTRLNAALLHPDRRHPRTYWVQVEGSPTDETLDRLRAGVHFRVKKKELRARPLEARPLTAEEADSVPARNPPVRFRKSIPDTWLALTLTEGKNRQVRRMCAAVGHPVLRLLRHRIEDVSLEDLKGEPVRSVPGPWLRERLGL